MANRPSTLPGRIPPQTTPLVEQLPDGRFVADINWYLYFYNLGQQVLAGSTGTVNYTPADLVAIQDDDVVSTDTAAFSRQIANALLQLPDQEVSPSQRDLTNALLSALDGLPQDPVARAQPAVAVTVGASPFTFTATFNGTLAVSAGIVSAIALIRHGSTVATGVIAGMVPVSRLDQVQITYTTAPTVEFLPS